jgi:hypothetical protein
MASETYAPNPANCVLGKGKIYFDRHTTAGVKSGFFEIGNANELEASLDSTRITLPNFLTPDGGDYAEAEVSKTVTISMTVYEFNRKNIALLTGGVENSATQATQTVSGETLVASSALGQVLQTAYRNVTVTSVLAGTATLTTADYSVVDSTAGLIKLLTTGAAPEGVAVTASYTAAPIAATANKFVDLHSAGTIYGSLLYVSANSAGAEGEMKYWRVSVQPGGLKGLIGNEFGSSTLTFKSLNDSAGTYSGLATAAAVLSPYGRWYRR